MGEIWCAIPRVRYTPSCHPVVVVYMRFVCVFSGLQVMRFFWKATPDSMDHQGVKCKIMRPVSLCSLCPGSSSSWYLFWSVCPEVGI